MNKWSTSLPSIISLCNDVEFNFEPTFIQQAPPTTTNTASPSSSSSSLNKNLHNNNGNGGGGSSTDLSIHIQTKRPFNNYEQYPTNYNQSSKPTHSFYDPSMEHKTTTIQTNITTHEKFVPDDELVQSLVAYADSFDLDTSIYSIHNTKQQPTTTSSTTTTTTTTQTSLRRRAQSSTATHLTSIIENDPLLRHKSCEDLSIICSVTNSCKPTTVVSQEEHRIKTNVTKFVPSKSHPQFLFATKTNERNYKEKPIEENTSTTNGSKFEWEYSSNIVNELNKPTTDFYNNYEASTNIADINLNYLKDLERFSSMAASMDFSPEISTPIPPPPVIIRRKSKDLLFKQQVDIQLLRPPTPPPPAPIIIREIRHKPPPSLTKPITIHQKLETSGQLRISKTPPPIVLRERPPLPPRHDQSSKPTIVYRHLPTPPPSPPTIIVERLRPHVSTFIQKPPPILVEKWLPYPPEQKRKVIYERASPLPMRNKRHINEQGKRIIVEYDKVNVIVDKDIKQRKEIKRVNPNQYVKQYGNSLYSNESLNHLLTNATCTSQMKNQNPFLSRQHHYENYAPMFH